MPFFVKTRSGLQFLSLLGEIGKWEKRILIEAKKIVIYCFILNNLFGIICFNKQKKRFN